MTTQAFHALAPTFRYTSVVGDLFDGDLHVVADSETYSVPIPTGDYRMCLAPTTGPVTDLLRTIEAAVNAAFGGSGLSLAVSLSAAGVVTLAFAGGDVEEVNFSNDLYRILGLETDEFDPFVGSSLVGVRPVWYLALMTAAVGPFWQPAQAGGVARTTGGRVYCVAASRTSWSRDLEVGFQPTLPAHRAESGCEATAFYPAPEFLDALGSTAVAREWSVLDVLFVARNSLCGYASGTWQTLRMSTTERYWLGYVGGSTILGASTTPIKAEWLAWASWRLELVAPVAAPTGTRA